MNARPFLVAAISFGLAAATLPATLHAQTKVAESAPTLVADATSSSALPNAPGALIAGDSPAPQQTAGGRTVYPPRDPSTQPPPVAPLRLKYIPAGFAFQAITPKDKVAIGFRDLFTIGDLGSVIISAGYTHLTNGQPHYGVDRGAFGQQLGAAAVNEVSEGLLEDVVFSSLFREDPRYFVQGRSHSFGHRLGYALSRVVVVRNDNGSQGPNLALFASYAATHGIDMAFYPQQDRTFSRAAQGFVGSLGGAAISYVVSEFTGGLFSSSHPERAKKD